MNFMWRKIYATIGKEHLVITSKYPASAQVTFLTGFSNALRSIGAFSTSQTEAVFLPH